MLNAAGPLFLHLFRNAVMTHDVGSFFQNILLVSCLPWVIVVDHIRHTVFISTVRHYADMSFFDRHDLSEPFRALYAQYAAKISEAVQTTKNASEFLLKRFLFKSATTYFHAPFPANYLRHK